MSEMPPDPVAAWAMQREASMLAAEWQHEDLMTAVRRDVTMDAERLERGQRYHADLMATLGRIGDALERIARALEGPS